MEAQPRQIQTYLTAEGISPFEEWLDALRDRNARIRIKTRLKRLSLGNFGDSKSVGSGVYELRVDYGPGYRIYYGQIGATVVLLLCGGDKSRQDQDIRRAKEYWVDYEKRENTDE